MGIKRSWLVVAGFLGLGPSLFAQTNVSYSDIVGYTSFIAKGRSNAVGAAQYFSFVPAQLRKDPVFNGIANASGTTVNLPGASLTSGGLSPSAGYPTHYLIITSGPNSGVLSDIVSNTANTVTTTDNLTSSLTASNTTVAIVPHTKVTDILGTSGSQKIQGGSTIASADSVFLVGSDGTLKSYYYKTGVGAGLKSSSNADATGLVVYPGESLLIGRRALADSGQLLITGSVPNHDVKTSFSQGFTTAASGVPTSLVLSNLTSIVQGGSALSSADLLYTVDPGTGQLRTFYLKTGVGSGWKTSSNANADASTDVSGGFILLRRSSTPVWLNQARTW